MTTTNEDPGVAESGLGVGESLVTGLLWRVHRELGHEGQGFGALGYECEHAPCDTIRDWFTDQSGGIAPPSLATTTPNPIPDQVLTPLSAALFEAADRLFGAVAHVAGYKRVHQRDIDNFPSSYVIGSTAYEALDEAARDVADALTAIDGWNHEQRREIAAAALAGVPKEAGEDECWCGHDRQKHLRKYNDAEAWCRSCYGEALPQTTYEHEFDVGVVAAPVEDASGECATCVALGFPGVPDGVEGLHGLKAHNTDSRGPMCFDCIDAAVCTDGADVHPKPTVGQARHPFKAVTNG